MAWKQINPGGKAVDSMSPGSFSLDQLRWISHWLFGDALQMANIIQIPALIITGGIAWLLCRPVQGWITDRISRQPNHHQLDVLHRPWIIQRLVPLITPATWVFGLWIAIAVAERTGWPDAVARVAMNLLLAWLVIRLAADVVPNAVLAQVIASLAWGVAALNILHLLGPALSLLDSAAIVLGGLRVSLLTVVKGVLSLTTLLWVASVISTLFERRITHVADITPRARVLLGKLLKATLVTLAVVVSLTTIGVDLSTFALFTGALGVGVGLGLQRTVSNLFSGIVLLLDRSIKPGDVIEIGGTYGWVVSLGARYVAVETRDGTEFLIPNEDIITQQVINWSHNDERVRLKVPIRVPHDSYLDQVIALIIEASAVPPRVLPTPAPTALIMAFAESAIELELRFWITDAQNGVHNVKSQILYEIWRLFKRQGIRIPYPKRELYMRATQISDGPVATEQQSALPG